MTGTRVTLDPFAVADLATRLGVDAGPLSPWSTEPTGATPGAPPEANLRDALTTIVTATAAAWVRLSGAGRTLEYGAWFTGERAAALGPVADGLVVETPPASEFVAGLAVDVFGASSLRAVELDLTIDPLSALLLGVVVDEARRDALLASAMGMPFVPRGVAAADVAGLLQGLVTGAGVTALVVAAHGDPVDVPPAGSVLDAFGALVGCGHLTEEGGRFVPAAAVRELASRFLACTARLALTAGWIAADGTVARAGVHAAQYGVHDVIVAERVGATLRLATEPAATIIEHVRAFIGGAPLALVA